MMSALFHVFLLAGIAHVAFLMPSKDNVLLVTSSLLQSNGETATHPRRNLLNLDGSGSNDKIHETVVDSGPSSVVQDWSLVCKQLCGAGLGGLPCAPHCTVVHGVSPSVQLNNAVSVLSPNKKLICNDLCRLQLGADNCACSKITMLGAIKPIINLSERNNVCNTFCIHNKATLSGCSPCKLSQTAIAAMALEENSGQNMQAADTTTPDWNELCVSLCKTGDGGSLCKCDLSPFL